MSNQYVSTTTISNQTYNFKDKWARQELARIDNIINPPVIVGIRVNYTTETPTITRLEAGEGLTPGADFDDLPMYKRRRCNLADDGTVNAYYGDENYTEDGSNG